MPNYQDGKIYKIESPQNDQIYIGSTTQKLCKRMTTHRSDFKCKKGECSSSKILEYGDAKIYLIELFPCNSKEELEAREGHWQKEMRGKGLLINKKTAGKCDTKALKKQYREKNRHIIKIKRKQYIETDRKYYKDNRDKILKQKSDNYEKNRDHINARRRELTKCDICCKSLTRGSLSNHKKLKHV